MAILLRALWVLLLATGCATARLAQTQSPYPPDPGIGRTVVLEPLFEMAEWKTSTRTDYAQVNLGPGASYSPFVTQTVPVTRQVSEKPHFAKAQTLMDLHRHLLLEVQRRRPSWRVTSTGGAAILEGEVAIVRTIIEGNETVTSNRTLRNLCFGVGLVLWPLLYCAAQPVEETELVSGLLERFLLPASDLPRRLVKYPTQPDFAVNLAGAAALRHRFGLDVSYSEGLLASQEPRPAVMTLGLVDRLATAIIAIVEEP